MEPAITLELGKGTGKQSPADQVTRPAHSVRVRALRCRAWPKLRSLYRTVGLVPQRLVRNWPEILQQAHAIKLAKLYRQES